MQLTIYYTKDDKSLVGQIEAASKTRRMSRGAFILSMAEEYFGRRQRLGETLRSIGALSSEELEKALKIQRDEKKRRLLGEILLDEGFVDEETLRESLSLQKTKKG
jgi:hypothetical protein